MTLAEAIRTRMLSHAPLASLVGTRIYPARLPQNPVYPAVTYSRVTGSYQSDIATGASVFQFDIWAEGYSGAENLCRVLRTSLERERFVSGSIEVLSCTLLGTPRDLYDDGVQKHRIALDFKINYREV